MSLSDKRGGCIIFNPVARGEQAKRFYNQLARLGKECSLKKTQIPGQGRELARRAVEEGYKIIVCAGGDGTLNEVINGIGDVEGGFKRVTVGVIPLGTSNVFAREHNIPLNVDDALKTLMSGIRERIDLPYVEFEKDGKRERRYFIQLGGAGLDARAVEVLSWELKKRIGWLAYIIAGLKAVCEKQPVIEVKSDEVNTTGNLVLFGNGRFYGGSFKIFPLASFNDGYLDLAVYPEVNYLTALRCIPGFFTKNFSYKGGARYYKCAAFELRSAGRVGFELDGEFVGELPITVKLQRYGIEVIKPGS
ncbi:MAG: diacylglycerol/lipid kinase family protein [Verrucomicrobiia bacterium]